MRNGIKLIAFDLDGVLVDGGGSWTATHEGLGTLAQSQKNGRDFYSGKITFDDWAHKDVELWKGVDIEEIKKILYKTELMKGIDETIPRLKKEYRVAIISGGLKILADHVQERYGIDYSVGNELLLKDGKVAGIKHVVDFESKGRILADVAKKSGYTAKQCAAVGDYLNDIPMFKEAGFSIAFNPKNPEVIEYADEVVYEKDLTNILKYF